MDIFRDGKLILHTSSHTEELKDDSSLHLQNDPSNLNAQIKPGTPYKVEQVRPQFPDIVT
jgi:hypothetical protein